MNLWTGVMLAAGGLFAGGAATFAWSRVPIWRRMAVREFVSDFAQTLGWTDKVQPGLLVAAIIGTGAYALTAGNPVAGVAAVGFVITLAASVAVLVPLQRQIIATPLDQHEGIQEMRDRWFRGNLGRAVLSTASYMLAVISVLIAS